MPALTVLMPVYNAEKFLSEAIDSILEQTFQDFEFIIIDDGSSDKSASIIQSYSDPRIRFYTNKENEGISATLNKGIKLAEAPWIARMDADDISYPDRLEKQMTYLEANPDCAMVSTLTRVISETGDVLWVDRIRSEHFYYNLAFICWIYHPTVLFSKTAVQEAGMYTATYSEDFELFWQISRRYKIYNLPTILLDYRVTDQSLHQVLKKTEYEIAQQEQVLRNLRYYAGSNYTLPSSFIACFRHNFEPLKKELNLHKIIACIKELDFLTECILSRDNPNYDAVAIRTAAMYKKHYILSNLSDGLPIMQKAYLWLRLESFRTILKLLKSGLITNVKACSVPDKTVNNALKSALNQPLHNINHRI
ncbi:glycosyltransferase family 2 protein [Pontibacter pudoricolor]|uniref:glycosyltransferase family 2 protein n=1 Tax=Pontibacter pudoricolor TaxID=2694930 RepID=UPI001391234E|nr:glycosyltransferase [Pontibacter pudoricolor]